jgi:hypothetical protein
MTMLYQHAVLGMVIPVSRVTIGALRGTRRLREDDVRSTS